MSSIDFLVCSIMDNQAKAAQMPSFSRMWLEPVPNDSSPHKQSLSASIKLPKYFQPVGVSKISFFFAAATLQKAN